MAILSSITLFRQFQTSQVKSIIGGTHLDNPVDVQHVSLSHIHKGDVLLSSFIGKTVIAFFGYTHCPDICPITLMDLAEMYQAWGEPTDVQIIMVTVDNKRDTPAIMQQYVENFHPSFLGFSGSATQTIAATKSFFVGFAQQEDSLFLHTDSVFLIDKEGKMRSLYAQDKLEHLAVDIEKHLATDAQTEITYSYKP